MRKSYKAQIQQLPFMLQDILKHARSLGVTSRLLNRIEVVAEEALVNIIHHSYDDQEGIIEIDCPEVEGQFELLIADEGKPFDPLTQAPQVDVHAPLEERTYGGYGVFLIREIMDEVHYSREGNRNVLRMVKRL